MGTDKVKRDFFLVKEDGNYDEPDGRHKLVIKPNSDWDSSIEGNLISPLSDLEQLMVRLDRETARHPIFPRWRRASIPEEVFWKEFWRGLWKILPKLSFYM